MHQVNQGHLHKLQLHRDREATQRQQQNSHKEGVRQGDTISPKLFAACLEHIFKDINWKDKGINVNGERLRHLRFADDIVIIANNFHKMESMLQYLNIASRKRGLKMNMKKTRQWQVKITRVIIKWHKIGIHLPGSTIHSYRKEPNNKKNQGRLASIC